MKDGGSLFDNLLKRQYHDDNDLHVRVDHLSLYLLDIVEATKGIVTTEGLTGAGSILDLGMGKGALGVYLRTIDMHGRLVGVDTDDYRNEGATGYDHYDRIEVGKSIQELVARRGLTGESFDYVACIAPSQNLLDWILVHFGEIPLSTNGKIIIATEREARVVHGFDLYKGVSMLEYIYLL